MLTLVLRFLPAGLLCLPLVVLGQTDAVDRRHRDLVEEIARHDELYFRRATPKITDSAYDALKQEYETLLALHPRLAEAGVLPGIGDDRTGLFPVRAHLSPMLSLRKAIGEDEVRVFDSRLRSSPGEAVVCVLEPKYDGVALSVVYEYGRLVRAVTRGNGFEGDEVTDNARRLLHLPETLPGERENLPSRVELRGEVFVTHAQFERENRRRLSAGETPFSHPRSLAAGTLRSTHAAAQDRRELSFVVHGWGLWEPAASQPASARRFADQLGRWGIPAVEHAVTAQGAAELWENLRALEKQRRTWAFPTDGVVIKVDETNVRERMGSGTDAPPWALAFKFPPARVRTRVESIVLQIGRTGVLTPVAGLVPVTIDGVVVSRATLHSKSHLERLDVRVGDMIELERAGEVIPRIVKVCVEERVPDAQSFAWPARCPSCDATLAYREGKDIPRCPRRDCAAQVLRRLEHFVSAEALDLSGFGPVLLEALVKDAGLRSPAGLYALSEESLRRAGGEGSALRRALEASRSERLERVLNGLGVPRLGPVAARRLSDALEGLEDFLTLADNPEAEAWKVLTPAVRESVREFLSDPAARAEVVDLVGVGVGRGQGAARVRSVAGKLSGEVVVFSGALTGCHRDEAERWVRNAGGTVGSSVSANTTMLVAGDSPGEKLAIARRLGVTVLNEAEFRARLGGDREASP